MEDLLGRMEVPTERNKWERPLFTVTPATPPLGEWDGLDALLEAIMQANRLVESTTTRKVLLADTNSLHEMDSATQAVLREIMEGGAADGGRVLVPSAGDGAHLNLSGPVTLAELRRLRRGFLKVMNLHPPHQGQNPARLFLNHLQSML